MIVAAVYVFTLAIDEAYITYSHTRNFARSGKPVSVLQHVLDPPPMIEREKKLDLFPYGGLTMVCYAVDREQLKAGDWMRVRLNLLVSRINDSYTTWMRDNPVLNITTDLTSADGEVVTARQFRPVDNLPYRTLGRRWNLSDLHGSTCAGAFIARRLRTVGAG